MSQAVVSELTKKYLRKTPELKTGYTVRVHQKIKEGDKERVQVFEGLIIKMNGGKGVGGTITVRKITEGVGVEKIFPIHSPNIVKIEVKKIAKVRRSKLYYMRKLSGKSARLREQQVNIVSDQELLHTEKEKTPETAEKNVAETENIAKKADEEAENKTNQTPAKEEAKAPVTEQEAETEKPKAQATENAKQANEEKVEKETPTETEEEKK